MGRKKKSPIINRSFWVYAQSDDMAARWSKAAENAGIPESRFLGELIEQRIENGGFQSAKEKDRQLSELQAQLQHLRIENAAQEKKIQMLESFATRLDEENRKLRSTPFLENDFKGERVFEQRLIDLFKEKRAIKETELLDLLHVSPTDSDSTRAIMRQLDVLQKYNLIKKSGGSLRWQG